MKMIGFRKMHGRLFDSRNILGLLISVIVFCTGLAISGNMWIYFNLASLLIVFGGTVGATLVCFPSKRLSCVRKVVLSSYRTRIKEPEEIVEIMVDLSVKRKMQGLLSLQKDEEETSLLFLRRALGFLVDNFRATQIRDFLSTEMYFFRIRREETERVLRTMAEVAPAFGLVGSIVGLVGMLAGVSDATVIMATVPIALTSTLYGIILANFFLLPLAENVRERTHRELVLQKIILEGVVAIESEVKPRILERKLKSFLTPSSRHNRLVSLKSIQEKFNISADPSDGPLTSEPEGRARFSIGAAG